MKMVVGLGNPGRAYEWTRHNVGFWVLDELARRLDLRWQKSRLTAAFVADGAFPFPPQSQETANKVLFVKPQTYMNRSGEAVRALVEYYRLSPEEIIVVYDDLDLEPMVLRIRQKGSSGGHRGIESIIRCLGTETFGRLKVGIGRPPHPALSAADYVLQPLPNAERQQWEPTVHRAADAVQAIIVEGYAAAMNRFHRKEER